MSKDRFMHGALILFIAGIFVKVIGFLFQILVIRKIGTEAVGLINMVFPLYITVLVITTSGLPLAISKMVSYQVALNNLHGAMKIFRISLFLLVLLAINFTVILIFFAPWIINSLYNDPRVLGCFYIMIPGIIIVSICSAFRGFFQGLQEMFPPALTQCIEQIIRILLALLLINILYPYGIKAIAMGLAGSMIVGEFIGLIIIYFFYLFRKRKIKATIQSVGKTLPTKAIIKELFAFGFPTTLTRLTNSIVLTIEASLIPHTLESSGFTINQAASIYGQFSGVAMALLTIPTVLTFSLATSLVPSISEAEAQGKISSLQFRSTEALRLTYVIGLPITVILLLKASSLCGLLFNLPEAGITLRYLACGAIFLYLVQTSNGILQGLGLVKNILFNTAIGAIIKLFGIIYLVSRPELNINGAAISFVISYAIVCFLNLLNINKKTGFKFKINQLLFPLVGSLLLGFIIIVVTKYFQDFFSENIITVLSILLSGGVYFILMVILKQLKIDYFFQKK